MNIMVFTIIQARMNSSRLPGKVLIDVCGTPELVHVVRRVIRAKTVDRVIVATTDTKSDDPIERCCIENNICFYRGSENDVLDRFYKAALEFNVSENDYIVRVTADCPFIDADVIDKVINAAIKSKRDYVSNTIKPTYPDGLDIEVFTFKTLKYAWENAFLKSEREHVTPYIYKNPEKFSLLNVEGLEDLSELRWTLDEKDDLDVILSVYNELYFKDNFFGLRDIIKLFRERPDIFSKNMSYKRNEGYIKSLQED